MLNIVILSKSHLKKLKEYKLALILTIAVVFTSFSQNPVGIGTVTPDPSAILEVSSTNKGFLPPHMLEEKMRTINSPAEGLIVYCTDCTPKGIYVYSGSRFNRHPLLDETPVEYLNIDDVRITSGTTSFDISPTLILIPSEATVEYELIKKPTGATINGTRINIAADINYGEYNIIVKATGYGGYSGVTGATFKLNVVLLQPSTDETCFTFSSGTGTITDYKNNCPKNVIIPTSIGEVTVTSIGNQAFLENSLTSVTIPNSVTSIGESAFNKNNLTSVAIPDSVTRIENYAFANNKLSSVTIPNSVTRIGVGAFAVNKLSSVTIPDSVTSIGIRAFSTNNLTSVIIPNSVTSIGKWAFEHNELTSLIILNSVTSIGVAAFEHNELTSLIIPNSVTSIGDWAFQDNKLTSVSIKSGTTYTASGTNASFDPDCTEASGCITLRP